MISRCCFTEDGKKMSQTLYRTSTAIFLHITTIFSDVPVAVSVVRARGAPLKGATSRFLHLEKFSLNFSNFPFAIRVNLLHP